jgi:predicted ATPase
MTLAQDLNHSFSLAYSFIFGATLHQFLGDKTATYKWAEAAITLSNEQGFSAYVAIGNIFAGWALSEQGRAEEGLARMHQGLTTMHDTGAALWRPYFLALLAEIYGKMGNVEGGLVGLREAQGLIDQTSEHLWEPELYRLKGELTLQKFQHSSCKLPVTEPQCFNSDYQSEAEACFLKAIEIARSQQAKSLELRAVMSLSRIWQSRGKKKPAHELLAETYAWFTEGFNTVDLREAQALLQEPI